MILRLFAIDAKGIEFEIARQLGDCSDWTSRKCDTNSEGFFIIYAIDLRL